MFTCVNIIKQTILTFQVVFEQQIEIMFSIFIVSLSLISLQL